MPPFPEHSSTSEFADVVKVKTVLNSRKAALKLQGQYTYDDLKTIGPLHCAWEIRQAATGLAVHGHLMGALALECSRCLAPFQVPVDVQLDEQYVLARYVDESDREKELQAEDFFEVIDEEGELDLKDLAHQFLVLESTEQTTCGQPECSFKET